MEILIIFILLDTPCLGELGPAQLGAGHHGAPCQHGEDCAGEHAGQGDQDRRQLLKNSKEKS